MPLLIVMVLRYKLSHRDGAALQKLKFRTLTLSALVFAWIGDAALLFEHLEEWLFMIGLSSFLITHICFAWSFTLRFSSARVIRYLKQQPWLIFVTLAYAAGIFILISGNLGDMLFPVIIYIVVISAMLLTAIDRGEAVNKSAFIAAVIGSILFAFSDSIIAYSKFASDFTYAEPAIMLLYGLAQLSIVYGALAILAEE